MSANRSTEELHKNKKPDHYSQWKLSVFGRARVTNWHVFRSLPLTFLVTCMWFRAFQGATSFVLVKTRFMQRILLCKRNYNQVFVGERGLVSIHIRTTNSVCKNAHKSGREVCRTWSFKNIHSASVPSKRHLSRKYVVIHSKCHNMFRGHVLWRHWFLQGGCFCLVLWSWLVDMVTHDSTHLLGVRFKINIPLALQ